LHIRSKKGETRLKLPKDLHVKIDDTMMKEIINLCGKDSVRFEV